MNGTKKLLTSAVALTTAAALALGGTFAWQSISQTAKNEASDHVNPGGRLHNDQHWVGPMVNDTNIYVENFTDPNEKGETIYARVRLEEYMELVMNYGVDDVENVETIVGAKYAIDENGDAAETPDEVNATQKGKYKYEYVIHDFNKDFASADEDEGEGDDSEGEKDTDIAPGNPTGEYWTWNIGLTYNDDGSEKADSRPYYMPTYNKDKDSLMADLNGEYKDTLGGISKREDKQYEYAEYTAGQKVTHWAVYDGQTGTAENITDRAVMNDLIQNGDQSEYYDSYKNKVELLQEEHEAEQVGKTRGLISMKDWLALEEDTDDYWVYDTDGWVYWSSPIEAGDTTGLLLDSIALNRVMDNTWYYAINVVAQFVTADDVGVKDGTGFYDTDAGTVPTDEAVQLLTKIGVKFGEDDESTVTELHVYSYDKGVQNVLSVTDSSKNQFVLCKGNTDEHPTGAEQFAVVPTGGDELTRGTDFTYDTDTGLLTILLKDNDERLSSYGTELDVSINDDVNGGFQAAIYMIWNDDGMLTLTEKQDDSTIAKIGQAVKVNGATSILIKAYNEESYTIEQIEDGYTFDANTGLLTVTDTKYAGDYVDVYNDDETLKATLFLAASTSNGDESTGGGQTDEDSSNTTDEELITLDLSKYSICVRDTEDVHYWAMNGATNGDNDKMHWKGMYTILRWDVYDEDEEASKELVFGYEDYSLNNKLMESESERNETYGFRPVISIDEDTNDRSWKKGQCVIAGTLYVGETPVKVPADDYSDILAYAYEQGEKITVRQALDDPDYQMKMYSIYDTDDNDEPYFVADRCMLKNFAREDFENFVEIEDLEGSD